MQALSGDGFKSETVEKLLDESMFCDAEDCACVDYDYEIVSEENGSVLVPFNN